MGSKETIFQPPTEARPSQKGHRLVITPLDARGELPTPRATLSANVERERAQHLTRIFHCIERGLARGKRLNKMMVKHAWRWRAGPSQNTPRRGGHLPKTNNILL